MAARHDLTGAWKDGWYLVPYQVIFRDLDAFGHVNNAVYFSFFEWGRAVLWWDLTGRRGPREIDFIVAHAQCDFRLQLGLEPIEIASRIGEMRNSSFEFHAEIRRADGSVAATGMVVVVLWDWDRQTKRTIDDELRRRIAECSLHVS